MGRGKQIRRGNDSEEKRTNGQSHVQQNLCGADIKDEGCGQGDEEEEYHLAQDDYRFHGCIFLK